MDIMDIGENSRSRKMKRKRRLPDKETVFNYMTGMYEKVKKSKPSDTENTSTISPTENTKIDAIIDNVYGSANHTSTTLDSSKNEETSSQKNQKQVRTTNSTTSSKCGEEVDSECSDIEITAEYILDPSSNQQSTRGIKTSAVDVFMCLHCSFVACSRDLLKSHALEHYNQQFKCSEHLDTKDDQCSSCQYESILTELKNEVFLKEKTLLKHQRDKTNHRKSIETGGTSASADFKYFDCDFQTWPEDKFSQFKCPEHSEIIDDCIKCISKAALVEKNLNSETGRIVELSSDEETREKSVDVSTNDSEECVPENCHNSSSIGSASPNCNRQGESAGQDENMESPNRSQPQLNDEDHVPDINSEDAIDILSNELDSENGPQITSNSEPNYKCFQCDFMTNERKHLQTHARRHDGGFKCVEHYGMKATCLKCIYQDCALIENDQTTFELEDNKDYKCFDCNYKTDSPSAFRRHAWSHRGSKYSCPSHLIHNIKCDMCYYEKCLRAPLKMRECDCGYTTFRSDHFARHNCPAKSRNSHTNKKYHKCFDCDYRTLRKEHLQSHACRHADSKYSCPNHRVLDAKCDMCFYGKCLRTISSRIRICNDCGYTAYRKDHLDRHRKRKHQHKK